MVPDGIKDRFELYRKWLKTLLIKEFMNLPTKYQERFMVLIEKFLEDCKKIHGEGKVIKERVIKLTVVETRPVYDTPISYKVYCQSSELENKVVLSYSQGNNLPKIGDKICHTVFSLDEKVWYSSKEELINSTKRSSL